MSGERSCPMCGGDRIRAFGTRGAFDGSRCGACAHVFVTPLPTNAELERYYREYSYAEPVSSVPEFVRSIIDGVIATFEPARATNRLLDVGFGEGVVLEAARDAGWDAVGVEVSEAAVDLAARRGLEVHLEDFVGSQRFEDFDVVVMTELVEHVPDPGAFLARAHAALRPGGLLYATTPHGRGTSARVLRARWSVFSPPEHLHLFSRSSLTSAVRRAGFDRIRVRSSGVGAGELLSAGRSLLTRAPSEPFDRVTADYQLNEQLVSSRSGSVLKRAVNRGLGATGLGDGLRVWAWR